mmetsp:Transcript_19960/g.62784  ORF Transcript_19960/g.62784 Transcript_19960/m.62784 type:complete len:245 (-) Transcript_19960:345-1079(-)
MGAIGNILRPERGSRENRSVFFFARERPCRAIGVDLSVRDRLRSQVLSVRSPLSRGRVSAQLRASTSQRRSAFGRLSKTRDVERFSIVVVAARSHLCVALHRRSAQSVSARPVLLDRKACSDELLVESCLYFLLSRAVCRRGARHPQEQHRVAHEHEHDPAPDNSHSQVRYGPVRPTLNRLDPPRHVRCGDLLAPVPRRARERHRRHAPQASKTRGRRARHVVRRRLSHRLGPWTCSAHSRLPL